MKNLKNFDTKEDFLLEQEKPLYNTILHNEDEVYIQPTMATYVCDGETNCIKLTNRKDLFSSFTVNGVEMINPNEPSMLGELVENPLYYYNNNVEHIEEQIKYEQIKYNVTNEFFMPTKHPFITFSFGRKLVEGESIVFNIYYGPSIVINVGDNIFNECVIYNENDNKYIIDYWCLDDMTTRAGAITYSLYGCANKNGFLTNINDLIPTTVYDFDRYVDGEPTYIETEVTLTEIEPIPCYLNAIDMQNALNLVIDFGRIIDETDIVSMLYIENGNIIDVSDASYDTFINVFQLIEGTTKYIAMHTVQTYVINPDLKVSFALKSTNEDGTENINYDFKYSYDIIHPFTKGYELKCTFKFIDDTINGYDVFYDCDHLKSIDLRSYKNLKIGVCYDLFSYNSLETIKLCDVEFINNHNNNFYSLFGGCFNLKSVDLTPFLNNIQPYHDTFSSMFRFCESLQMIKMMGDISNVSGFDYMFDGIPNKGIFYCDNRYDYSKIIEKLPQGWEVYKI